MNKNQFEINDLIDDAVNNALVRRSEALLSLNNEEANSIAGGTTKLPVLGVVLNPDPIIIGVVIDPKPIPCPPPKPHIINGIVINPNPPCLPKPIINGIFIDRDALA